MSEKYQWINGIKFTRDDKTGYYLNSAIRERIHRYVWKYHNGEIPDGYQVHHKDGDRSNNDISNLHLMKFSKHLSYHGIKRDIEDHSRMVSTMQYARTFADEWHGSKDGRNWHKEHYEAMKEKLYQKIEIICEQCGKTFEAISNGQNRFCSNKCKSAWRRKAGVDDETRTCAACGKEFRVNKYSNTKCCSKSCSNRTSPRLPQLRARKED